MNKLLFKSVSVILLIVVCVLLILKLKNKEKLKINSKADSLYSQLSDRRKAAYKIFKRRSNEIRGQQKRLFSEDTRTRKKRMRDKKKIVFPEKTMNEQQSIRNRINQLKRKIKIVKLKVIGNITNIVKRINNFELKADKKLTIVDYNSLKTKTLKELKKYEVLFQNKLDKIIKS